MKAPHELEGALMRHFMKDRHKRLLYHIAHTSYYLPIEFTNGRATIFHGYTGHSDQGPILHLVQVLRRKMGFTVFTCDFPYHGLSNDPKKPSELGKIKSFLKWIHTAHVGIYQILKMRDHLPGESGKKRKLGRFIIGESAGIVAPLRLLQIHPSIQKHIAGVVILALPLEVDQNASTWVQEHKRFLEPIFGLLARVFPNLPVGDLPKGDHKDALEYQGRIRARTAKEIRDAVFEVRKALEKITVPVLFIHSDSDGVALPGPVEVAYRTVSTPEDKKQFIVYRGAPHKVMHLAVDDIQRWIEERNAAQDWEPFPVPEEGVVNETVKLSSSVWVAVSNIILYVPRVLRLWWKKISGQNKEEKKES